MCVEVGDTSGSGYPLVSAEEETSEVGPVEVEWWPQGRPNLSLVSPRKNFSPLPGRSCSGGAGCGECGW